MRSLFAVTMLGALTLAGCDLNPPAPQKAAQATCNCTPSPPAAPAPQAPPVPAVTPQPAPREHASRHHVRHFARWHGRHHRDNTDYAYNYHSQSTYTADTDHHSHTTEWTDGYGRRHTMWADAGAGSDYDPRWRNDPYHGYGVNCPNPQR